MEHELKLQPRYYEYILGGTKDIEIRLYDEKRQKINIGDIIIFKKEPELNESFKVKNSSGKSCVNMADLYKYFLKIQLNSGIIQ